MTTTTITHSKAVRFDDIGDAFQAMEEVQTVAGILSVQMTAHTFRKVSFVVCEGDNNRDVARIACLLENLF